jgi:hypothetical protein
MRFELDLLRESVPPDPEQRTEPTRKHLRETTDALIHGALLVNDLPELVRMSAETMCSVATALLRFEINPDVPDFVEASQALIEDGRAVMDRGLTLRSWETTRIGAVMLEIAVRGICAALSVPYDKVLPEVHRAQLAGENANVRAILIEAGLLKAEEPESVTPEVEP